jgi:hypothetical protein
MLASFLSRHAYNNLGRFAILHRGLRAGKAMCFLKINACFGLHNFIQTKIGVTDTMQKVACAAVTEVLTFSIETMLLLTRVRRFKSKCMIL